MLWTISVFNPVVDSVIVNKINEVYFQLEAEPHVLLQLNEFMTFEVPNFNFIKMRNKKLRYWDGKVKIFDLKNRLLPTGLIDHFLEWCSDNKIICDYEKEINDVDDTVIRKIMELLIKKAGLVWNEDQFKAVLNLYTNKKALLVLPTGVGKSAVAYVLSKLIPDARILIITPTVQLTEQLRKSFIQYGANSADIKLLRYGESKDIDLQENQVLIGTYQSLIKLDKEVFKQFDVVIGDEAHLYESKSLETILKLCVNCEYRIGMTGSLKDTKIHELKLQAIFGKIYKPTTVVEQIKKGRLAKFKINVLIIRYDDETIKEFKSNVKEYHEEIEFLISNKNRNAILTNLMASTKKNTLLLFTRTETHGIPLFESLKRDTRKNVFYVDGNVSLGDREHAREFTNNNENCLIVASYATFSTGIDIPNIHGLILGSPTKSITRVMQSIGRTIRLHESKDVAVIWDIVDDLSYKNKPNYALKHFYERLKLYKDEGFEYSVNSIDLEDIDNGK